MKQPTSLRPAEGKLGVLLPGMGAVATTFIAGALLAAAGVSWGLFVYLAPQLGSDPLVLILAESRHFAEGAVAFPAVAAAAALSLASWGSGRGWRALSALGLVAAEWLALGTLSGVEWPTTSFQPAFWAPRWALPLLVRPILTAVAQLVLALVEDERAADLHLGPHPMREDGKRTRLADAFHVLWWHAHERAGADHAGSVRAENDG